MHLEVELENHLKCFGRNQCYPVGTGKGIWWYWAASGSGTGKSVSITMVATVQNVVLYKTEKFFLTKATQIASKLGNKKTNHTDLTQKAFELS